MFLFLTESNVQQSQIFHLQSSIKKRDFLQGGRGFDPINSVEISVDLCGG